MDNKKFDLEDRFVEFTCKMIDVVEALPSTRTGNYIAGQLIRSCHSPTFNYGEVQAAESRNDFIHKMGIVLKELKEFEFTSHKTAISKMRNYFKTNLENLDKEHSYLYIDVGGGSTELTFFNEGKLMYKESFNIEIVSNK